MTDAHKNILITPARGTSAEPSIVCTGYDNVSISLKVLDNGTLSFEGSAGQLLSITNTLTGTIFSVNDVSGIPSIEVLDTGEIKLAPFGGSVSVSSTLHSAKTTDSTSRTTGAITAAGGIASEKHITAAQGFAVESVAKPSAPTVALAGSPGNVDNGNHWYWVTYTTANGETELGNISSVLTVSDKTVNGQVNVTIPVSADPRVTGRKIYRNTANGISYVEVYLLATINDNTTTLYVDNVADANMSPPPTGAGTSYFYKDNFTVQLLKDHTSSKPLAYTSTLNTALGYGALNTMLAGTAISGYNTAVGTWSLSNLTTGVQNTAVGNNAGASVSSGNDNVFMGQSAGYAVTTGGANLMIGRNTGGANKSGAANVYLGYYSAYGAGVTNANGSSNAAVGSSSMYSMTSGSYNTTVGSISMYVNTTGSFNTSLGYAALYANSSGSRNLALGAYAGRYETGSNTFYVDVYDRSTLAGGQTGSLLYGTFNTTASSQQLTVNGNTTLTYNATVGGTLGVTGSSTFSGDMTLSKAAPNLIVVSSSGNANLIACSPAGAAASVRFKNEAQIQRWAIGKSTHSETGSNAGSNFEVIALSDAGAVLSYPLTIARASGITTLTGLNVDGLASLSGDLAMLKASPTLTVQTSTTGNSKIKVQSAAGDATIGAYASTTTGTAGLFLGKYLEQVRWRIEKDNTLETGSDAGSDFYIKAVGDAGFISFTPVKITRATGLVTLNNGLTVGTNASVVEYVETPDVRAISQVMGAY